MNKNKFRSNPSAEARSPDLHCGAKDLKYPRIRDEITRYQPQSPRHMNGLFSSPYIYLILSTRFGRPRRNDLETGSIPGHPCLTFLDTRLVIYKLVWSRFREWCRRCSDRTNQKVNKQMISKQ